jgi:MFS family permease
MKSSAGYDRSFVAWLSLVQLISWGSLFYTFALLMGPVEQALGLGRAQASLAFSLALLAEGLLAYPLGRLIDAGHERVVMTAGSLLAAASLAAHAFIGSVAGFYAVWVVIGCAMAATLYTPAFAIVTRRFPHDFRRAIITLTFLGGLASTVFIPLTAWLITLLGWRHALLALAAVHLLVCAPLHARVLRPLAPRPVGADITTGHATAAQTPSPSTAPAGRPAADLGTYLRSTPFLLIGVFVVMMMAITAALPPHMVSLLRENGLGEAWAVAIPASIGVIQVLGRLLLYFFEHRFDLHLANRLIPCLIPLGLATLLAAPWLGSAQWVLVLLFVLLFGMGNGMMTIVKGTAIAQYVNREHVASLNGALGLPTALTRAAAPLLMGLMWSAANGYRSGLWLLLLAGLVAVAALVLAQKRSL